MKLLVGILVLLALLLFWAAIFWAGQVSVSHVKDLDERQVPTEDRVPAAVPPVITLIMAGIGAALATFFGALFGISQFTGGNPRPIPKWYQVHVWATLPERKSKTPPGMQADDTAGGTTGPQQQTLNRLQVVAAYVYVLGLIGATVFWALTSFSPHAADPIRNLSTSFLGVLAGVLTVTLSVRQG